jgi:hypothetical protein
MGKSGGSATRNLIDVYIPGLFAAIARRVAAKRR